MDQKEAAAVLGFTYELMIKLLTKPSSMTDAFSIEYPKQVDLILNWLQNQREKCLMTTFLPAVRTFLGGGRSWCPHRQ